MDCGGLKFQYSAILRGGRSGKFLQSVFGLLVAFGGGGVGHFPDQPSDTIILSFRRFGIERECHKKTTARSWLAFAAGARAKHAEFSSIFNFR